MTQLYSVDLQQRGRDYVRRNLITAIVLVSVAIVLSIVSCIITVDEQYLYYMTFNCVMCVGSMWVGYYILDCHIRTEKNELEVGDDAMNARKLTVTGRVEEFADHVESVHKILCYKLLIVSADGEETYCHLSQRRFTGGFQKGDTVTLECYGNTVVAFRKEEQA